MKRQWKRIIAVLMAAVMLLSVLPMGALAALTDNDPAYNREMLEALKSVVGSEAEAKQYYALLEENGLLDEDGNIAQNWSIQMNGEDITLDELRAVLAGDYDPKAYVWVDGTPVTLEDVKTMIEIEDYVAYIRDTYFTDREMTPEQISSYRSLMAQIEEQGITMVGNGSPEPEMVWPSGVNHHAFLLVTPAIKQYDPSQKLPLVTYSFGETVTYNAEIVGAEPGQTVSFDWVGIDGTCGFDSKSRSGTVTLTAGSDGTATKSFTVKLGGCTVSTTNQTLLQTVNYLQVKNVKNAKLAYNRETRETEYSVISSGFPESGVITTVENKRFLHYVQGYGGHGGTRVAAGSKPEIASYRVPAGTYKTGDIIPIIITYDHLIDYKNSGSLQFPSGESYCHEYYRLDDDHEGTIMDYSYQVGEQETSTSLVFKYIDWPYFYDANGEWDHKNIYFNADHTGVTVPGVVLQATPQKAKAITGISAQIGGTVAAPTMDVTVDLTDNELYTDWMGSGEFVNRVSQSYKVSVDGGETLYDLALSGSQITGGTMTASIPLPVNTSESAKRYTAEIFLDGELLIGDRSTTATYEGVNENGKRVYRYTVTDSDRYATAVLEPATLITAADVTDVTLSVMQHGGNTPYTSADGVVYMQDQPDVSLSYTLANKEYTFPELTWSSSNPDVADVNSDGSTVTLKSAGKCSFILTAANGGVPGKTVTWQTGEIEVGLGLTPFLYFSKTDIKSVSGKPVTLYWSSNLCDKNEDASTTFHVSVTRGGEEVYTQDVTGTKAKPAASVTIPASVMTYNYDEGAVNTFDVTVTGVFNGQTYTATAAISLDSIPAKIRLQPLDDYIILDTANVVNIQWDITNFDRFSSEDGADLFRLEISKGGETTTITNPCAPADFESNEDGHYIGSYTLSDLAFDAGSDPSSYRDVYTVTIRAKNGTDSTWSYDSFILYVYDEDALKIWVDGEDQGDSLTMSNIPRISQMTQDEILALQRDIQLRHVISANYGEYAWTELDDQIAWASSNNDSAAVNYRRGSIYSDIRNYSYTSYRPTTDFVLSGLDEGETTITAQHVLTGMTDSVDVTVERLDNKLYLFQCYPQATTILTYKDSTGTEKTVTSDEKGAAAVYEENGIHSDVHCSSYSGAYIGTIYQKNLVSGEQNLDRYPCNYLTMRRAAYAYLYLKNPYGTPFTGKITFRGGVYVNGEYKPAAKFSLNGSGNGTASLFGSIDQTVDLGSDGKLTVAMDQTQWGLANNDVTADDQIRYVFLIKPKDSDEYYPILADIDATVNQKAFVNKGEAVLNFRENNLTGEHPFVIAQTTDVTNPATGYTESTNVLDSTERIGPSDSMPESVLNTTVLWWGESAAQNGKLKLSVTDGNEIAPNASVQSNDAYPFTEETITTFTVPLNGSTLGGLLQSGKTSNLYLSYFRDGANLSRKEMLPFQVSNMVGVGKAEDARSLQEAIQKMGNYAGTNGQNSMSTGDMFVNLALGLVAGGKFTEGRGGLFSMKLVPTSDPTKFLGFVELNVGNMNGNVTGVYADPSNGTMFSYKPGIRETILLATMGKGADAFLKYGMAKSNEYNKVLKHKGVNDYSFTLGGYMETLIYYDAQEGKWVMTVLDGGFNAGGGMTFSRYWNYMVGPVPFTVQLSLGGTAEVSMDAITAAYSKTSPTDPVSLDTEYLTELRLYLYLKLFAGIGADYSIAALKLGIFGQISLDMQFRFLNRPYLEAHPHAYLQSNGKMNQASANLTGQHFKINGTVGIEFMVKVLFIKYEKVLFSYSFNFLNKATGKWETINALWDANQKNLQGAIESLLTNDSASINHVGGGQQMLSLNMAPTVEDRDYLADGGRSWGNSGGLITRIRKARAAAVTGLGNLESNTYPYADPELSRDGRLLVYLSDMDSEDVTGTRAAFAVKNGGSFAQGGAIDNGADSGFGDSQVVVDGTADFAVSAWTRQTVNLEKDAGSVLTAEDQMMMLNGSEIYAAVYDDGENWNTVRLTENGGADVAPTVATNGEKAIVAWRSVSAGDAENITDFDQKDTILYKTFDGENWSRAQSLYNGTGGAVKGVTSTMMANGTAAVAYTLDKDLDESTIDDREVVYAVVAPDGTVTRTVQATSNEKVDENPQLAVVSFPTDAQNTQRFVLGWFTQEMQDDAAVSDICLFDFDEDGITGQRMPQSLSQATGDGDVQISSDFRFAKNAESINDLSIIWVERDEGDTQTIADSDNAEDGSVDADLGEISTEKDVLKGVKFYTYGQNDELIGFTAALNVAEMPDATLIDHFDAYSNGGTSITAAVLGTTYGKDGATEEKIGETVGGDIVSYTVPKAVSAMYTATDTYEDKIEVPAVLPDYETVKLGAKTQIQFTVRNAGLHAVSALTVDVGGTVTEYTDLNLLPGSTMQIWADYDVPANKVVDPTYTVTATFSTGEQTASDTIYLDVCDLQITDAQIMDESEGNRVIQIKLGNGSDAALADSGRSVKLSFWSDPSHETAIESLPDITITNNADLRMIDEGGYSCQTTFDVEAYVKGESEETVEIPENGVPVFILAEIVRDGENDAETTYSNNDASVTCDNLQVRTGQDVTLVSDFSVSDENVTTVTVNMQNTRLSQTTTGNVIVTLLDENGEVIDQQQSYNATASGNKGLITLGGEAKGTQTFTFYNEAAASAEVTYSDVVLDDDNVNLTSISFSNIPGVTLESFAEQPDGTYTAVAALGDLTSTAVMAVTESGLSKASVKVNGGADSVGSNALSQDVALTPGEINTITVTVTAITGETREYILTVCPHAFDEPVAWTWSEDCSSAAATLTCALCGTTKEVDAVITPATTAATYTTEGQTVYTATVTQGSFTCTDTRTVSLPKLTAHDQQSVTINDQIHINLLLDLDTRGRTTKDVTIKLGEKNYSTKGTRVNGGTYDGLYKFTVEMAPAQIADTITVSIAGDAQPLVTSVMDYCVILAGSDYSKSVKVQRLVKAILSYGQAASIAFDYNTGVTIDENYAEMNRSAVKSAETVFTDKTAKVTGASFMALTKPEFRFYTSTITKEEAVAYNRSGIEAVYSGENAPAETLNARFVKNANGDVLLEVTGVSAENMDKTIVVTISGMDDAHNTITFNGNAFAKAMAKSSDPVSQDLGAALYNYGVAAKRCFGA